MACNNDDNNNATGGGATEVQEVSLDFSSETVSQMSTEGSCQLSVFSDHFNSRVNTERIQNVENCFGSSGQPLRENGRVLVGEGVLVKMCRKKPKPRQVFLFNDILVYGNILIPKKKYIKQNIIPLERVSLENLEDTADMKNGWVIRTPTKSFVVYAASKTEKQQWMSHISTCISELLKKTGMNPSKEHAAVWVPDSDAGKCMVCKETKFTLLNRRHHCRKCGCVVCANCSQQKFMLPAQSSKPVRVCDCCYFALSMGKGEVDVSAEETVAADSSIDKNESKDLRDADTTDDSEDDEEADDDTTAGQQAEIKEEKPTFYPEKDASKSDENLKEKVTDDVKEKMDEMKISAEPKEN